MDGRKLHLVQRSELDRLIQLLRQDHYTVVGPTVRENAIGYQEIQSAGDLPVGWSDRHEAGRYEITRGDHSQVFGYVVGADSWKRFLFPPKIRVFCAERKGGPNEPFAVDSRRTEPPRYAFIGARACELAAIGIQDRVVSSELVDPYYRKAREQAFIVAVNCTEPGSTCFCSSMGTGPRCLRSFDLCLTELDGELAIEVGSEQGAALLQRLNFRDATHAEQRLFELMMERSADHMGRRLETDGLPELLSASAESPRWEQIAKRCLACANCTMVCPTCFCYNVHDHTDLTATKAERWRLWGSCFTLEFSYLGSSNVRTEGFSRYRQWMTHKLSSWNQQFGTSGCVGCGRCITWCPVGIDITAEAAGFQRDAAASSAQESASSGKEVHS
jgi:ferredoxin